MQQKDKLKEVLAASEAKNVYPVSGEKYDFSLISYRHLTSQNERNIRNFLDWIKLRHSFEVVVVGGGYGCSHIEVIVIMQNQSDAADFVLRLMKDEEFRGKASSLGFRVMILPKPYIRQDLLNGNIETDPDTAELFARGTSINIDKSIHITGNVTNSNIAAHSPTAILNLTQEGQLDILYKAILDAAEKHSGISKSEAIAISTQISELRAELGKLSPNVTLIERILSNLGSTASIASLVDQIKPFLKGLLP